MYYIYVHVQAIPTYRVYRLYNYVLSSRHWAIATDCSGRQEGNTKAST